MKEKVYGWYPPAKNIYTSRGPHTKYQQECLYKFKGTMYESKPVVPPSPNLMIRGYSPAPPNLSRPTSATEQRTTITSTKTRPKTAPVPRFKLIPRLNIPTPSQCWATKVPETDYTSVPQVEGGRPPTAASSISWPHPRGYKKDIPPETVRSVQNEQEDMSQISWPRPNLRPETPFSDNPDQTTSRERIKSACVRRERTPLPARPVRSAGPCRTPSPCKEPSADRELALSKPEPPVIPQTGDQADDELQDEAEDWEIAREKHGWLAEVHGNPYGYKKIPKRLPYTVKCVEPQLAPEPPTIHMENLETFFFNTIPHRHYGYTIHKEWISETLHAKRLELQKRHGIKYRWKNFGFVY